MHLERSGALPRQPYPNADGAPSFGSQRIIIDSVIEGRLATNSTLIGPG
jgi:hypothetical protein